MKLLIFCYEYPPIGGGAGNALAHLIRAWAGNGHQIALVTSGYRNLPEEENSDGVKIIRLPVGRKHVGQGRLVEMLRYGMKSVSAGEAVYRTFQPDLAIAFMTLPSGLAPLKLHRCYGLPFVTELRGGDVPGFMPRSLGFFHFLAGSAIRSIWKNSASVIANSEGLASLAHRACPELRVQVMPNGVDTRFFSPVNLQKTAAEPKRCIFVGRIVDSQKRIGRLIQAVGRIQGLRLTVVGAGPDESRLKEQAERMVPGRAEFLGWVKGEDLLTALRSSDVYVSASGWEGMSNSALEAMSCGLPLLLSDIPGHRELVVKEQNGFLFDSDSPNELEERIQSMISDPAALDRMGSASRKRAVEHFDWTKLATHHLNLYVQAAGS